MYSQLRRVLVVGEDTCQAINKKLQKFVEEFVTGKQRRIKGGREDHFESFEKCMCCFFLSFLCNLFGLSFQSSRVVSTCIILAFGEVYSLYFTLDRVIQSILIVMFTVSKVSDTIRTSESMA